MRSLFLLLAWVSSVPAGTSVVRHQDLVPELQQRALRYFIENVNPTTGLIRDRARNFEETPNEGIYRMASIASTGFGMVILAHAAANQIIPRDQAYGIIEKIMITATSKMYRHKGWLYHFVDWESGERFGNCEVSTIDTAWFMAGALYARRMFPGTKVDELAVKMYDELDFDDMRTDGGTLPSKQTLSLGWTPEDGYIPFDWDKYAEHMWLYILGIGRKSNPLAVGTWANWQRIPIESENQSPMLAPRLPLFIHQYSHLFLDLRHQHDAFTNYFKNSVEVTKWARDFCVTSGAFATYRAGFWGLSAGDSNTFYQAFSPDNHNGTVCIGCALASSIFDATVLKDAEKWWNSALPIVGRYGFTDSLNLDVNWIDADVIGITVGAIYLSLANLNGPSSPWAVFQKDPDIERGLKLAGFNG